MSKLAPKPVRFNCACHPEARARPKKGNSIHLVQQDQLHPIGSNPKDFIHKKEKEQHEKLEMQMYREKIMEKLTPDNPNLLKKAAMLIEKLIQSEENRKKRFGKNK
ncbi:MAG: hypothetical protein HQK53_15610 [Oligoflexia bacterium]|nr:hypothetical protein [Oligoflexia bacterium]